MASSAAVETHLDEEEEGEDDDGDDDEEECEYEYEEIEVEEEIIEEIEVEVDEDDDDETIGEPLTPTNEENHSNDNSPSKEPERHEVHMKSGSMIPGESIANAPDDPVLEGYKGNPEVSALSETSKQEESSGRRTPIDHCDKASIGESGVMNTENMKRSGGEMVSAVGADASVERGNGVQYFEEETDGIAAEDAVDISKRSDPIQIRQRSLSPELNDGNKRAAIICDFFAKGWCIKGKSCRFLHIRDKVADTSQLKEGAADAAKQKSEPPVGEASSVAQNSAWDDGESAKWKSEAGGLPSQKDDPGSISSPKHFGRESLGRRSYLDHYGHYAPQLVKDSSPAYSNGSFREAFSGSPLISSDRHKKAGISSNATSLGEVNYKRTQVSLGDDSFLVSSHSLKRSPLSFSSTSWNADPILTQKRLDSGPEHQASISSSFQRNSLPFPGSESGYHSQTNFLGDAKRPAEYKTNISFGNWEPSVPFRPSYLITQRLLTKENLYDPIRDSIEQTNSGDGLSKFCLSGQGASRDGTKLQKKANMESAGTLRAEYSSAGTLRAEYSSTKNFISSHNFHDNETGKSVFEKDLSTTESEIVETAVAEQPCRHNFPKDEKSLNSTHVRDIRGADKIDDSESGVQRDKPKQKTEPKIDRARQNNDADVDLKTDGYAQESKALKNFHAALVEHVKELVRPTWHEGLLSRDAHKLIVKKAVDKVLSTLQPHQIPNTSELVEQYLVVSQTKLAKLVEAYVDKYGKS